MQHPVPCRQLHASLLLAEVVLLLLLALHLHLLALLLLQTVLTMLLLLRVEAPQTAKQHRAAPMRRKLL
jgi:hypothetical protein